MNPVSIGKSLVASARGLTKVLPKCGKITITAEKAKAMLNIQKAEFAGMRFRPVSNDPYAAPYLEKVYDIVTVPRQDVTTKVLKNLVEMGEAVRNPKLTLTLENTAGKKAGTSILKSTLSNGDEVIGRIATKVTPNEVISGGKVSGQSFYSYIKGAKKGGVAVADMAKALGVDIDVASKRLAKAQSYGYNVKKPEIMKKAILGDFESRECVKGLGNSASTGGADSVLKNPCRIGWISTWNGLQ